MAAPLGELSIAELAETRGVRECLQWFTREKQWVNERHLELCRVPAPTFLEERRAAWFAEQLRACGYSAGIDQAGNVVAVLANDDAQPLIAVTAHLDTVLAPRKPDDISVEADGRFHGPGVADNGAGLAALLALGWALKAAPRADRQRSGIALVANVGEEGEGNLSGMRYLAIQSPLAQRIRTYLVIDGPALDRITSEALASRRFEISFAGPGGHPWTDAGYANPIHALAGVIAAFTSERPPHPVGNGARSSTYNFATIEGGQSINSIPVSARAKVDIRSKYEASIDEMAAGLAAAVERARDAENERSSGGKLAAKIREIGSRPAGQLPADAPLLACLRAVDAHLGIRARMDCSSTDANIPLSLGIPALAIGGGGQGGGAHTAGEWYDPDGRDLGLKRIALLLALLVRC